MLSSGGATCSMIMAAGNNTENTRPACAAHRRIRQNTAVSASAPTLITSHLDRVQLNECTPLPVPPASLAALSGTHDGTAARRVRTPGVFH